MADEITAHLADGRTLHFPSGTKPEVIQRVVKQLVSGQHPTVPEPGQASRLALKYEQGVKPHASIGPQPTPPQPNLLQRGVQKLGEITSVPSSYAKAGVLFPLQEAVGRVSPGVKTTSAADRRNVAALEKMSLRQRAAALRDQPIRSLGKPEKERGRQIADEAASGLGRAMASAGEFGASIVSDPLTYIGAGAYAKLPAKATKALSAGLAAQQLAPYIADPEEIKRNPKKFLADAVMAGLAAGHATGLIKTPKPGQEQFEPRKFTVPEKQAIASETAFKGRVKPTKSPKIAPRKPPTEEVKAMAEVVKKRGAEPTVSRKQAQEAFAVRKAEADRIAELNKARQAEQSEAAKAAIRAAAAKKKGTRTGSRKTGAIRFGYVEGSPAHEFELAKQRAGEKLGEAGPALQSAVAATATRTGQRNAAQEGVQQDRSAIEHKGNDKGRARPEASGRGRVQPAAKVQGKQEEVGREAGVRHATLQAIAQRHNLPEIPRGEGVSTEHLLEFGKEALKRGANPETHLQAALGKKPVAGYKIGESAAIARAHLDELTAKMDQAGDALRDHPNDSALKTKYEQAKVKWQDYGERQKKIGTEVFHAVGMSMQASTDVDTGSFTAVSRAYQERNEAATGRKTMTAFETQQAERLTTEVKQTKTAAESASNKLNEHMQKQAETKTARGRGKLPTDPAELGKHLQGKLEAYKKRKIKRGAVGASSKPNPAFSPADRTAIWDYAKGKYIGQPGVDYHDVLNNTATDLGIPVDDVRRIFESDPRTRTLAKDFFEQMSRRRIAERKAQAFIDWGARPELERIYDLTLGVPRNLKIYGHGGVMMTSHAGPNVFDPMHTGTWARNFINGFRYWKNGQFHEQAMMKIERDPDFGTWDKAGLAVDPNKTFDDYQMWEGIAKHIAGTKNPVVSTIGKGAEKVLKPLIRFGETGNRGADALKSWRFETAKSIWQKLPASIKGPGITKALIRKGSRKLTGISDDIRTEDLRNQIATWVNHASGHGSLGKGEVKRIGGKILSSSSKFPSTWARVVGDPLKTLNGVQRMARGVATPEEGWMTTFRLYRAARLSSVFIGALAVNDQLQKVRSPANRVNFTQPWKSDWLHFKAGDRQLDPTGGVLGPLHLLGVAWAIKTGEMKPLHGESGRESAGQAFLHYVEGQMSPGWDTALSATFGEDFLGRPLPWSSKPGTASKPKYSWYEWLLEQGPIPIQESVQSVYEDFRKNGMSKDAADKALGAIYALGLASVGVRNMPATKPSPGRTPALPRNPDFPRQRNTFGSDFKD